MKSLIHLFRAELRSVSNRWAFADEETRRFRVLLMFLGVVVFLIIAGVSHRIFFHLLYRLDAPELAGPLILRLMEMAHLLFFVMLFISSLSVALSVLYLDPEIVFLLTTPVSHALVLAERMVVVVIRSSWFVVFAGAAMLGAYAVAATPGNLVFAFLHAMALLLFYLLAPVCFGILGTVIIVRFIPARRAKSALMVLSVISLSAIILGMRGMMPEKFLNPREDPDVGYILEAVAEPAAPWLPSGWAASGVTTRSWRDFRRISLFGLGTFAATLAMAIPWHKRGLRRILQGETTSFRKSASDYLAIPLRMLPPVLRLAVRKDALLFWRDPSQWSQLIVLLALVVLYTFNFQQLKGEFAAYILRDVISFVNLGMAGFILVAIANRFVFSAVSLEGRAIWLLKSSPYPLERLLWAKAIVSFIPLFILAEVITFLANRVMEVSPGFTAASALVVALMTASLTSMGIGFGALAPRFDLKDPAQIGMTQSGIFFMAIGMGYVLLFVIALAAQVVAALRYKFLGGVTSPGLIAAVVAGCVALNACAIILPWRAGMRRIRELEVYV